MHIRMHIIIDIIMEAVFFMVFLLFSLSESLFSKWIGAILSQFFYLVNSFAKNYFKKSKGKKISSFLPIFRNFICFCSCFPVIISAESCVFLSGAAP